ncbi:MAG TPA: hypothetical protein DC047_11750 [Blastocatellia bacterium]|nr:hypothetical protein [Blastocatellia bacterium]
MVYRLGSKKSIAKSVGSGHQGSALVAALPPSVRKGYAFPQVLLGLRGYASKIGGAASDQLDALR